MHIVDTLIRERAPRLSRSGVWPLVRPPLDALLDYREARRMADEIAPMSGPAALAHVSALLGLRLEVHGAERVPATGRCLVAANHPTGIADGVAMHDALRPRRADLRFFANRDASRVCPGLDEVLVPVVWPPSERTMETMKETLRRATAAFEAEAAVVVFPAGRVAGRERGRPRERAWEDTPVTLARKHDVPLVPAHVSGPTPRLFHMLGRVSTELRDVTLFHELLNKKGGVYRIVFGPAVAPGALSAGEADETARRLRRYVEDVLPEAPDASFA